MNILRFFPVVLVIQVKLNIFYNSIFSLIEKYNFNENLDLWNVSKVTDFTNMFGSSSFNNGGSDSIKNWSIKTTGNVIMASMFTSATAFNQPLNWNTSRVVSMNNMFNGATAFQQNLGAWNISNVTDFTNFMASKIPSTFATTYMNNIFDSSTGWPSRTAQYNLTISFGSANYNASASSGLATMEAVYLWTIQTGGLI